jgi:hypothetical protein
MEGSLDETGACSSALLGAFEYGLHQLAAHAVVLRLRVDGDGAYAVNDGAFVKAVAAEDAAVGFGDYAVDVGRGEERADCTGGCFRMREVAGKIVRSADGGEGAVANISADGNVVSSGGANDHVGLGNRGHRDVLE